MAAKKKPNMISIILGIGTPMSKGKMGKGMRCPECGHEMDESQAHESASGDKEEDTKEEAMPKGKGASKSRLKALKEMMS